MLAKQSVEEFMARLGSKEATPGGGGAAALVGASAAGLVTMVARLTEGRPAFAAIEERVQEIIAEGDRLRAKLLAAIEADAAAFETVMAAYGLPKTSVAEKEARQAALQPALIGATEAPLTIARACLSVARIGAELAETANPQTISDAATAATLAEAALQSAIFQARINLKSIKDKAYVEQARQEIAALLDEAQTARQCATTALNNKLG